MDITTPQKTASIQLILEPLKYRSKIRLMIQ